MAERPHKKQQLIWNTGADIKPGFDPVGTRGYLDTLGTRCGFARYDPGFYIPCDSKCWALGDRRET